MLSRRLSSQLPALLALLTFLTLPPAALAQSGAAAPVSGPVSEVRVIGTDNADIVRVIVSARTGTPAQSIDLEAERDRVYSLGSFEAVTVSLEPAPAGPVLVIRVDENPLLGELAFRGVEAVPEDVIRDALRSQDLVEPGRVFNTVRAADGVATIQALYRARGFPFDPVVTAIPEPLAGGADAGTDPPIRLTFDVDESAAIDDIAFRGATVVPDEELGAAFAPLERAGTFDLSLYQQALQDVAETYRERGLRGSGVDTARAELTGGVLSLPVRELRIASVDTTAIGVDPSELSLGPGDLFDYDALLEDVQRLAEGREGDVRLDFRQTATGDVRVRFELGAPDTAGPIREIRIEGATVFTEEELRELLALEVGDTYTSTLAQEDFATLLRAYRDAGYVVLGLESYEGLGYLPYTWVDGTYILRIAEVRVEGYEVVFEGGEATTRDFVVTRYLPEPGSVANQEALLRGLRTVGRLGVVLPVNLQFVPGEDPTAATVQVLVRGQSTGVFVPAAQYATDSGFSATLSYNETNLWGRAHDLGIELNGRTTDIGLQLGGSVRYSIPWLYLDALDFQEVPTSVSLSLFSTISDDNLLSTGGRTRVPYPGLPDVEANQVFIGDYAQRDTGIAFSVGRRVLPDTDLLLRARGSYTRYILEDPEAECTFDEGGALENGDVCALPRAEAEAYLPQSGLSSFTSATLTYDGRDDPDFPRQGIAASGLIGIGFGTDYRNDAGEQTSYDYEQIEFGVKTYLALADVIPDFEDRNHVLAFRVNVGHQIGGDYPESKRFRVGKTIDEATAIRGYGTGDFGLSRTYATGSVEYRYDFGLETVATQTVIGIVFVDAGYASSVPGFPEYGAPVFGSAGVGVQVNLGFGGALLPALRFDYGFSERHPTGEFRFRIGQVF